MLYVIASPIGNLDDITLRALALLRKVGVIFCENTFHTRKLLARHGIPAPRLVKYTEHQRRRISELLDGLGRDDAALLVDAGTPGISDPGSELVRQAGERGMGVVAVPGPSALSAALSISGIPADRFLFAGFLPKKMGALKKLLRGAESLRMPLVAFESPHRIAKTLAFLAGDFPESRIFIAKELTKIHEAAFWGTPSQALRWLSGRNRAKGEFCLVFDYVLR